MPVTDSVAEVAISADVTQQAPAQGDLLTQPEDTISKGEEVAEAPEVAAVQTIDEQSVTENDTSVESNTPDDNAKVETVAAKVDAVAIAPEADEVIVQTTQSAPEKREEESKPAIKPKAKKAAAKSTKVSASVSKARASHPMATPASVEHEFNK